MCRVMSQFRVAACGSDECESQQQHVVFRKVLLTHCQREFEKDRSANNVLTQLRKNLEEAETVVSLPLNFKIDRHMCVNVILFSAF